MGGGASVPKDNYVLQVQSSEDSPLKKNAGKKKNGAEEKDLYSPGHPGSLKHGNSSKKIAGKAQRNSFDSAEEEKGTRGKKGGGAGKKSAESSPSSTPRNTPQQMVRKGICGRESPSNLGAIGRQGSRLASSGSSIAAMGKMGALERQGTTKKIDLVSSRKFPWLLKSGSFGTNVDSNSFEKGRIIGMGLMGTVRVARLKDKNVYCALKSIRKDYIHKHNDQRHVDNERVLMQQLKNPFCIKLFAPFQDGTHIHFAMELAVGGELFRRLNKKGGLSSDSTKFYAHEIFSAINHVQSLGYVYRDLKPENVMLDEDGHCKLVDFGFSTQPNSNGIVKTFCGTPAYLSPEQLDGKFTNGYSKIVDWWSLGILIYELMTGNTPFCSSNSETAYEIYLKIMKVKISFPRFFDNTSKELVQRLCHADLKCRLTDPDAIKHHEYFCMPWDAVNDRRLVPPFVPRIKDESDRDHYFNEYKEIPEKGDSTDSCRLDLEGF